MPSRAETTGPGIAWSRLALGTVLAAGLLLAAFHDTDWGAVARALRLANPGLVLLALALNVGCTALRAARWRALLAALGPAPSFALTWRSYVVGVGLSSVLAGRLGDLARPYLLSRKSPLPFAGALATIVTEHVLDLVAVLALFGIALLAPAVLGSPAPGSHGALAVALLTATAALFFAVALASVAGIFALTRWPTAASALLGRALAPLPARFGGRVLAVAESFARGVAPRSAPGHHLRLLAWTGAVWAVMVVATDIYLEAFGLQVPLLHTAWLSAAFALGVAIPTPGAVGTYQATALVVVGELWGLGRAQEGAVVAFALVSHLSFALLVTLLAAWYLLREGLTLRELADRASDLSGSGGGP